MNTTLIEKFDDAVTQTVSEIAPHCTRRGIGDAPNEDATTVIFDCAGAARPLKVKATGLDMRLNSHRIAEFADIKARATWKEFVVSGDDQKPETE